MGRGPDGQLVKLGEVAEVRIARMHGKVRRQGRYVGRKPDWKKAYVRLADGEKQIEFFEGV